MWIDLDIEDDDVTLHLSAEVSIRRGYAATRWEAADGPEVSIRQVYLVGATVSVYGTPIRFDLDHGQKVKRADWAKWEDQIEEAALEETAVC